MIFNASSSQKLGDMLERIVALEISTTQEMPAMVDLMVRHEEILSRVEGLRRPSKEEELSEFDVAFGNWESGRRTGLATTSTMPIFISLDLASRSEAA